MNHTKEKIICIVTFVTYLAFFLLVFTAIYIIRPPETYKLPDNRRTIILQDGTRIETTRFRIKQWTLQPGVTIDGNDYAGTYQILVGE